ncbi:MAG: L-threonylcarbamoyladenylate synthase [Bacteroidales bacterium]|jgi:tRNA threonylcarbamoyl adenosine modification protein (Sua5/YciO/YrdC/YwlC family)|nr:L-threonylcarbamoyladenylate synthase [Bacteroidales bacterium]MDD2204587.1 L-threonylcarbamoyladenylate synthase [Bacteroidales bacterium]MDD3152334.1 L-threonylcarbamoyladenylate synthase [Bacteroidales bacterium]MDD3914382.1 L-threonylcarbamoyladenylate synthase [Bacteroidales bacterium]MDD4633476.1 L-threonylcarbamoyladenylate synthase [Bacteroidales bacterium]
MKLKIYPENPNSRSIKTVVECIKDGGIIIYPTDTIYGLGCDINQIKTVHKIAQIKGTQIEKADFSLICYDLSNISDFTKPFPNNVFKLMKANLPGAFTFILNANSNVPALFKSKKKTIGIRVPDNNIVREIVKILGNPIVTTSIKDDDEIIEYTTDPDLIYERYENLIDIMIDGGYGDNQPSTVVDCTSDEPSIVRQGKGILKW